MWVHGRVYTGIFFIKTFLTGFGDTGNTSGDLYISHDKINLPASSRSVIIKPNCMKNRSSKKTSVFITSFAFILLAACSKDKENKNDNEDIVVISATGDINARLNEFRQLLGDQLNTTPGVTGGRREINWDGVPEEFLNKKLPNDFFNPTSTTASISNQRGLTYSAGGNFQVSKTNFAEVNPAASGEFTSFSGNKSFDNISSNLWEVGFEVAGHPVAASVKGFGIVFSDVDPPKTVSLEFFNEEKNLGKFFVPAKEGSNFSFLGVYFKNEQITRVSVMHDGQLDKGQNDISDNGPVDLVVMDNFLYSEPVKR
jgi:hypothetical protein